MYLIFLFVTFSIYFSLSTAQNPEYDSWRNESLNKFLDTVIYNVKNNAQGLPLDDFPLVNETEHVDNTTWLSKIFTMYKLYNGSIYNITTIGRSKDSFISYKGNVLQLDIGVNFKRIQINYYFEASGYYNFLSQNLLTESIINDLKVNFEVAMDTKALNASVTSLDFADTGPMVINLKGSEISTWIIQQVLNISTTWFEKRILNAVSKTIIKIVNEIFKEILQGIKA
ncbi:uncharacterized protein LOC106669644 isoform X2 [Cimex lectularius]|uniref:Uncharacterized protein n=1 Tax=Cimex lectularius TaxID=79782 RepID=A0A8I6RYK2_CIMLE|nr:uncharacterized protein LOC106669644 isoform X2 [Cimex lectularius]